MNNAHLKKRVMAMLVSSTMVAGAVSAPTASAASVRDTLNAIGQTAQSYVEVGGYEKLPQADLRMYDQNKNPNLVDNNINLLKTEWGSGWCVDWGNQNPWDPKNSGYQVRKLTGASGHYGEGLAINDDVRIAAINVTKSMMKDYESYKKGNWGAAQQIQVKSDMLRALLSNNRSTLNEARMKFLYSHGALFTQLTGFKVTQGSGTYGFGGVYLTPDRNQQRNIRASVGDHEYVTILVPNNYNVELTKKGNSQYQRIITVIQPGLDFEGNPPKKPWTGQETVETRTVYSTPPAVETTVTETVPERTVVKTIPGQPTRITQTRTVPPVTETSWEKLPPKKTTVTVTQPGREVTKTVTPPPLTWTTTTEVNGTPRTVTQTSTLPATETTVTEPGPTRVVETTITERPVVTTKPGTTVTEATTITPTRTTVVREPGETKTVTYTHTPERTAVSTTTVVVPENYYYEKYYERVREVHEYFYFAGFARDEKSKEIELPGGISGNWSWEITQGENLVIVERAGDGKLRITPREDFEGEGVVEILITDEDGNQHVFRVKVTNTVNVETSTNVKVNNFFYTIDPTSERRVQIIDKNDGEKATWIFVDQNGNRFEPKSGTIEVSDKEGPVKVEVKDPTFSGSVIVRVTDKDDNVRENIVTVQNNTKVFNYHQEILNTSTAVVERRGGNYTITKGEDLVDIKVTEDSYRITPKPGASGQVEIVFVDKDGNEYNYRLTIQQDAKDPFQRNDGIAFEQTVEIDRRDNWNVQVRSGRGVADVSEETNQDGQPIWRVTPKDKNGGVIILDILDGGTKIGEWTIRVAPSENFDQVALEERQRQVKDRSLVEIYRGFEGFEDLPANNLKITEGEEFIDRDRSEMKDGENWKLRFKPGAEGRVVVVESQFFMQDTDKKNPDGTPVQERVEKEITKFIYDVTPAEVREQTYNITADNELTLYGTNLTVKKGKDLLATEPQDGASQLRLDLKRSAEGRLEIENSTADGYVFERYVINVEKGQESAITPSNTKLTWNGTARIPFAQDDEWEVKEGGNLVEVTKDGQFLKVTPVGGQTGPVIIETRDKRGKWGEYHINVISPETVVREYDYLISTNSAFRATLAQEGNSFRLTEGSENFQNPEQKAGEWILRPKTDAVGKTGVVSEYDKNGREINRYNLTISQGRQVRAAEQRRAVSLSGTITFPYAPNGGNFSIVEGAQFVTPSDDASKREYTLTPDKTSNPVGQTVKLEERNDKGEVIRTAYVSIVADGVVNSEGAVISGKNTDLPGVNIDNSTTNGPVTINFPKGVADIAITDGVDKIDRIEDIEGGGVRIFPKPGLTEEALIKYILLADNGAQSWDEGSVTVNVKNTVKQQSGSSEDNCIPAVLGALSPLLLLIPVGILAQVQIPGLEGVSAQINGAIREANDYIQRGLGIYDRERAERAANIQGKLAAVNPEFIGLAAGSFGVITAGLLIADAVMRECGAGEYTSSYQLGEVLDNDTLRGGSSGVIPEKKPVNKTEREGSKSETNVKVDINGKPVAEATTN